MKKNYFIVTTVVCLIAAFLWWAKDLNQQEQDIVKQTSVPSPILEDQVQNTPAPNTIQRAPASKPEREWLGKNEDIIKTGKVSFTNKVHPSWNERLKNLLNRDLPERTELSIVNERDLVLINGKKATNAQQVVVIFNSPKKRSSYRALVDSQTGKIIRTWDHTIHETFRRPANSSLTPFPIDSTN